MEIDERDDLLTIFLNPRANCTTYDSKIDIPLSIVE